MFGTVSVKTISLPMRFTEAGFSLGDNLHVSDSKGPQ